MGTLATVDCPERANAGDAFETAKKIVMAGGDAEEIETALMLSPRRARSLYIRAQASITVDDYDWTPEQVATFARSALVRIAAEGLTSDDPKERKNALSAIEMLKKDTKGADDGRQASLQPAGLSVDLRDIIVTQ